MEHFIVCTGEKLINLRYVSMLLIETNEKSFNDDAPKRYFLKAVMKEDAVPHCISEVTVISSENKSEVEERLNTILEKMEIL